MPGPAQTTHRSRNGCRQCRQRKRKCDERHPCCTACSERSLPCNWQRDEPGCRHRMARRQRQFNQNFTVPQEVRPLMTIFTVPSTPIKDRLLAHFCATSPLWLTVGGAERGMTCQRLIMSGVIRSPLVLDCVLAVAAGDLSKYQPASSDLASLTYGFYGQAIIGIRDALSKELAPSESRPPDATGEDDLLLAILLLCVHEAVNFSNAARILPHINAAATLCHRRSFSLAADSDLRGLLLEVFCYFFALVAFSHGQHLQLDLALQVFNSPFLAASTYQGVLLGRRCREIFSCIHMINLLLNNAAPQLALDASAVSQLALDASAVSQLEAIQGRLDHLSAGEPATSQTDRQEAITTELYRLACSIYVRRALHPELTQRAAGTQELLAQFVAHLNMLPPTAPANGILCWPLVVAGLSSTIGTHQRLIVGRLRKIHELWRSDILSLSADMLSRVWREERVADSDSDGMGTRGTCTSGVQKLATMAEAMKTPILLL